MVGVIGRSAGVERICSGETPRSEADAMGTTGIIPSVAAVLAVTFGAAAVATLGWGVRLPHMGVALEVVAAVGLITLGSSRRQSAGRQALDLVPAISHAEAD